MNKIKTLVALLLCGVVAFAQTLTIVGPSGQVKAGASFNMSISLAGSAGMGVQALQFSIANMTWPVVVTPGAAASTAGKTVTCGQVGTTFNCIVAGLNTTLLADGGLATILVTVPRTTPSGSTPMTVSNLLAATTDATGNIVGAAVTAGTPFTLSTTSLCDLNADGAITAADLSLMTQQSLGLSACSSDLNSDAKCNVLEVQVVANSATGTCMAR